MNSAITNKVWILNHHGDFLHIQKKRGELPRASWVKWENQADKGKYIVSFYYQVS